jgi:hypothetical protein
LISDHVSMPSIDEIPILTSALIPRGPRGS